MREVKSVQSCHENQPLNAAATPDMQLLLELNSVHVTENGAHQLDRSGTNCELFAKRKLETLFFQPTAGGRKPKGERT